jgi:trehalose 6-phosphate phosphatase
MADTTFPDETSPDETSARGAGPGNGTEPPPPRPGDALFLDADGTLLEIAARPDEVAAAPGLVETLGRVHELLAGATAFVSGRRIADLDNIFKPLALPAAGVHGLERRRADDSCVRYETAAFMNTIRRHLEESLADRPGLLLEDKGLTVAVHYRRAPELEHHVRDLARTLVAGHEREIRLLEGRMVVEFQPLLADKGRAIAEFMGEPPFRGRRPVFLGDDVTDEDAFMAVNRLGGTTVLVGPTRATAARRRLPDVASVHRWLRSAVARET